MISLSQQLLNHWVVEAKAQAQKGKLPSYIPQLQQVNPNNLSFYLLDVNGSYLSAGDLTLVFPLMSLIKPFLLFYLLIHLGESSVFQKVGKSPSKYPFNSWEQLQQDQGFPRNPMINSGAIMLSSLLEGITAQIRCDNLCQWLNQIADTHLFLDQKILESVESKPNLKNQDLLSELVAKNNLKYPEITLATYNRICCLSGTIIDVAKLGLILMDTQIKQGTIVQEIMTIAGLYSASQQFQEKINYPTKSGVSGVILSLIPDQKRAIATYSPPLNEQGNSIAGLYLIEKIAEYLQSNSVN